jgi:hypothetical protein
MIAIGAASAAPAWSASAERLGDTLYYRASVGEANDPTSMATRAPPRESPSMTPAQ